MITVAHSGIIIYQSDHLVICTNLPSLPSQISTFGQVLHFCSATKGAVTWKTGSNFHKPYLGCMHVSVLRMGKGFYLLVQICFPLCMPSHLSTVVSKGRMLQKIVKAWSLPCFRKSLYTCVHICRAFTKIRLFRSDLEYVCMDRLLSVLHAGQTHASSWPAPFGKLESCISVALCPSEYKLPLRRAY